MPAPQKSRVTGIKNAKSKPKQAKSAKEQQPKPIEEKTLETRIPPETQQLILNIFKNSFKEWLEGDTFQPLLQEVKGHLFDRNFKEAFGREDYLEAYAARWSPSRALGYLGVLWRMRETLGLSGDDAPSVQEDAGKSWKVVCLGGGAGAEIGTLAGLQRLLADERKELGEGEVRLRKMEVVGVDSADWSRVVERLSNHITEPPPISKYASAAAKAANLPLVDGSAISISFHQHDVLNMDAPTTASLLENADLVTLMFTLNELYSTSTSLTQQFLHNLTSNLTPGAKLLVIDSPGSYSTVSLNGTDKNYPMQWLLDHTLLADTSGGKAKEEVRLWEKIQEDDSRWFRLDDRLQYPIELENMRMQLHLYQRL